jgi:hypothetical protein
LRFFAGEDFWRWQTMNPNGYRDDIECNSKATNGVHAVNGKGNAKAADVNGKSNGAATANVVEKLTN